MIRHGASSHPTSRCPHWTQTTSNQFQKAQDLDSQATQPPISELVVALKALPRAEDPPPPQTVNELMDCTLKDYEEECVEEETFPSDPATKVGEWEDQELNQMKMPISSSPIHPLCQPPDRIWPVKVQVSPRRMSCDLFEDTCEVMLDKLKEDTHLQVRNQLQRGLLKCQCGFTPKMK